ncbi:MAG: hypothetical protein WBQ60_00705 [Asticcacaulis sp.]
MKLTFDFAFEGFRLIRQRPILLAFWGALSLAGYSLMTWILVQQAGVPLSELMTMFAAGTQPDPMAAATLMQAIIPAFLLCLPVYILMSSILMCAIYRASTQEDGGQFGFLALGQAEIRIMIVRAATMFLLGAVLFGGAFVGTILAIIIGAGSAEGGKALQALSYIFALGAMIWTGLRLSLNAPLSFDTQRIDIFGSFAMTRGRFWSLFTGYAAAMALAQVVALLCDKIIEAIQVLSLGLKVTGDVRMADMSSLSALMTPSSVIFLLLTFAVVVPLTATIQLGAPVAAYKALKGQPLLNKPEKTVS